MSKSCNAKLIQICSMKKQTPLHLDGLRVSDLFSTNVPSAKFILLYIYIFSFTALDFFLLNCNDK